MNWQELVWLIWKWLRKKGHRMGLLFWLYDIESERKMQATQPDVELAWQCSHLGQCPIGSSLGRDCDSVHLLVNAVSLVHPWVRGQLRQSQIQRKMQQFQLGTSQRQCILGLKTHTANTGMTSLPTNVVQGSWTGDAVVLLAGQQTCKSRVMGSSPAWAPLHSGLGAGYLHLCASITKQYNLVPIKSGGDLFG